MAKPRLSAGAIGDLRDIGTYGRDRFGLRPASDYLAGLRDTINLIGERPLLGRNEASLEPGLRSFPHGIHRIYYRGEPGRVEISRILHQARDVELAFAESQ